jgi:hypothetical protein
MRDYYDEIEPVYGVGHTVRDPDARTYVLSGTIDQTRFHNWDLSPYTRLVMPCSAEVADKDAVSIHIDTTDGSGGIRGMCWRGGAVTTQPTDFDPAEGIDTFYDSGGFAIAVNRAGSGGLPLINCVFEGMNLAGGYGAMLFGGPGDTDSAMWVTVRESTLDNGVLLDQASDGFFFHRNVCSGLNPAYTVDVREGALQTTIEGGAITNRKGALQIFGGTFVKLLNVSIEHGVGNLIPNPDWDEVSGGTFGTGPSHQYLRGQNDSINATTGASVRVLGVSYKSTGTQIIGVNFGAGPYIANSIWLDNAIGTLIDECYFHVPRDYDLVLGADARQTVIGCRNLFRGVRTRAATGTFTDVSRLMIIYAGSPSPSGTRGMWHPASTVLSGFQNSWAIDGLELLMQESGMVVFNGGLTGGSTTGNICTFPAWCRPHQDAWLHATIKSTGAVATLKLTAATGVLSIVGTLANNGVTLSSAFFMAVPHTPYDTGIF